MWRNIVVGAIVGLLMIFIYIAVSLYISPPGFGFRHPEMTNGDKEMIKKAQRKLGKYPITREGVDGVWFMEHKGGSGDERTKGLRYNRSKISITPFHSGLTGGER